MTNSLDYVNLPDTVMMRVGEVTIRAGQLNDALIVEIKRAGSTTLADAFESAKDLRNRDKILDEAMRFLKAWTASNGVDIDVDAINERAKVAFRRRDEAAVHRCFAVGPGGVVVSRRHGVEMPFDPEQLSALADKIMLVITDLSAITKPNLMNDDDGQAPLEAESSTSFRPPKPASIT